MLQYWTCQNVTRQTTLGDKIKRADYYWARLLGLLPRKSLLSGEGLWLIPCREIHSVGMRFAFDAIFLDKTYTVVHLIQSMPPLRMSPHIKHVHTVLECPAETIQATQTQLGDVLDFKKNG